MSNLAWKPARTADPVINRAFQDLADKLAGIDALLGEIAVPSVEVIIRDFTITEEDFIDFRGTGAANVTLPKANGRGDGRATEVRIQNNGIVAINVRVQARETVNGLVVVSLAVGSMLIAISNGVDVWQAIVTSTPVARAGHVIQDNGSDQTQRRALNFIGATVADNPGSDSTDVTISAGHVIQDGGTPLTQQPNLNFVGFAVANDGPNSATKVTAPTTTAGHVIEDHEVSATQRSKLDFSTGAVVTDDSGNDRTKVAIRFPDLDGVWLAGAWYAAPVVVDPVAATTAISIGATSGDAGFLYAYPMYFGRDCTINKIAQRHSGGTGSGGCKSWQAIYSANAAGDAPGTRLADFEQVSTGFNTHSETTINLSVLAGTVLWFVIILNANEASNGYPRCGMEMLRPVLGTAYDGAAGTDFTFRLGYRVSFTYGQPPSTWSGTTKLTRSGSGVVPVILFTCTPV